VYLIVGLGNPGARYEDTRHNLGFDVIAHLSRELGVRLSERRFQSQSAKTTLGGKHVILLRPLTFMNLSGMSVEACARFYGLDAREILVVHDDADLPVGRVKVATNGGAGGHKGVASIIASLKSKAFSRVKIGIGRPRYGESVEEYVLAPFYRDQKELVRKVIGLAVHACKLFVSEGVQPAMNHINCQNLADEEVTS
jgi:PTH1 family peptidyl-tRNA hydrolase